MDSLEFKPSEEYRKLVEISSARKALLNLDNSFNYKKLGRQKLFEKYKYELHHIIPRYRFKNKSKDGLNNGENVAILTITEHLLAHYYLTLLESGNYLYSARMAFIQLFSLKKGAPELSLKEVIDLLPKLEECRLKYFGSETHKEGSRKAGRVAGEIRKQRFLSEPEYKKQILAKIARSPEKRKADGLIVTENNKKKAPWEINPSSGREDLVYIPQAWEYFDSIYIGYVKYNLSYKSIARCLGLDYRRISNIIRTLKTKENLPIDFKDYMFYDSFLEKYALTNERFLSKFEYYASEILPWVPNKKTEKIWYYFDIIFHKAIRILKDNNKLRMLDIHSFVPTNTASPKIYAELIKLYLRGVTKLESVPWIEDWRKMKTFYEFPPFTVII